LTIRFKTKLTKIGASTFVTLPKSVIAQIPTNDKTMIEGTIHNTFPFRAALERDSAGRNRLKVSKAVREAAGIKAGDTIIVEITRIGEEPEIRVPRDLYKAIATNKTAEAAWEKITPMSRRDWILSISTAKQEETRKRRIVKTCDMLAAGKGRLCCFPGINWMTKDHVKPEETWQRLPKLKKESQA